MATEQRAGGYVDRDDGKGWVIDDAPPKSPPKARPHADPVPGPERAGGWVLAPDKEPKPKPEPEPEAKAKSAKAEPKPNKAKPATTSKGR